VAETVEAPVVDRVDPDSTPILAVMLAAPHDVRTISEFADKRVKPRLERVRGVGSVRLVGARPREIRIWIDPIKLGGYALARRALAPIEQMTERARTITAERLSDRLPVAHPENEMGRLASVFNETLGRLEGSFDQMRHFTADVSHELRTPLTAIRSVGEVGLRGHRNEASYRSIIGSMLEEVDRLSQLVDRLLALSRAGTQQPPFALDTVDFAVLAADVVSHLGVLAEEKGQTLAIEKIASPRVRADRLVLRQALINLVDNAIKFTPQSGRVRIRLSETPSLAVVDVIDSGPGVPPHATPPRPG